VTSFLRVDFCCGTFRQARERLCSPRVEWLFPDVRRKHGFIANYWLIAFIFLGFWLPWVVDASLLDRFALRSLALPGLVTHPFFHVHSLHLLWNLLLLACFGGIACNELGNLRHAILFLVFSVVSGATHAMFDGDRAVGASGAVCGFAGLVLTLRMEGAVSFPDDSVRVRVQSLAKLLVLKDVLLWLLPDLHISLAGHCGGYAAGVIVGCLMCASPFLRGSKAS